MNSSKTLGSLDSTTGKTVPVFWVDRLRHAQATAEADFMSKMKAKRTRSRGLSPQDTPDECKTDIYTTYTIVAIFVPWIKQKVQETKERVVMDVEYTCSFQEEENNVKVSNITECKAMKNCTCEAGENDNPMQNSVRFKLRSSQRDPKDGRQLLLGFGEARVIEGISEAFPNVEGLRNINNPNRIERKTFANMTKLKKLKLYNNELISYHFFDDLVNLERSELMDCRMPKQPKNLFNVLRNLKVLRLWGGANWRILTDETFAKMSKLQDLTLAYIRLEKILENALNDLVELKSLELKRNSITKLPAGLFKNLRSLKSISLRNNKIEELPKELFTNNLKLEQIDLSGNKIKIIEADFTSLPKVRSISLSDNVCVNASFGAGKDNKHETVQELQEIVGGQCKQN